MHTEFPISANVAGGFFNHIYGCIKLNRRHSYRVQDDEHFASLRAGCASQIKFNSSHCGG